MKFFNIAINFVILSTLLFLIGKSLYIEFVCEKNAPKTRLFIFSGVALINIGLIIIPLAYVTSNSINLFSTKYIIILIILILFVIQTIATSRIVLFKKGLLCMGQYLDYKKIKKVSIGKRRLWNVVLIEFAGDTMSFRIGSKSSEKLASIFKEHFIPVKIFG